MKVSPSFITPDGDDSACKLITWPSKAVSFAFTRSTGSAARTCAAAPAMTPAAAQVNRKRENGFNAGLLEFEHELVGLAADVVLEHPLGAVVAGIVQVMAFRHQLETGRFHLLLGGGFLDAMQGFGDIIAGALPCALWSMMT